MKVSIVGKIESDQYNANYKVRITKGTGGSDKVIIKDLPNYNPESSEPKYYWIDGYAKTGCWAFRGYLVLVESDTYLSPDELMLITKHKVLCKNDYKYAIPESYKETIIRELKSLETDTESRTSSRERLTKSVRQYVWQRDGGKCVVCGSQEKLEYDHIIPVIKGGSNTERNIQILCETCNRSKGSSI